MALTLIVRPEWQTHLAEVNASIPDMVPVVKGNGYGFGRAGLCRLAVELGADELAVGTVYELSEAVASGATPIVLTPATPTDLGAVEVPAHAILTVGSAADIEAATGKGHRVIIKVASAMHRYGVALSDMVRTVGAISAAGLELHGYAIHLPLNAPTMNNMAEASIFLGALPDGATAYVSHLSADEMITLRNRHPHRIRPRLGTALWLGDKAHLALRAEVVHVRSVKAGEGAGYRGVVLAEDGQLVMVSAGTAHGVQAFPDGRSPFHVNRQRLALHEPPHMHTSMCFVPATHHPLKVGDLVDVQQPLTRVQPDRVQFLI